MTGPGYLAVMARWERYDDKTDAADRARRRALRAKLAARRTLTRKEG